MNPVTTNVPKSNFRYATDSSFATLFYSRYHRIEYVFKHNELLEVILCVSTKLLDFNNNKIMTNDIIYFIVLCADVSTKEWKLN